MSTLTAETINRIASGASRTVSLAGLSSHPERVRSALQFIDPHNRDAWVKMAFAIKSEFGDDGFDLWDDWGSAHPRPASEVKATWKSAKPGGRIGLGTLFYDAKAAGWKDDSKYEKPSAQVIEQRKAAAAARAAQYEAEEAAEQAKAAALAKRLWDEAEPCTTHPYLERKGVKSHGLKYGPFEVERTDPDSGEVFTQRMQALLVPMYDRQRELWSLQAISAKPGGKKLLLKGSRKAGNFFPIGKPLEHEGRKVFILAEGYATSASLHESTGHMTLMCVDASGLLTIAKQVRERDPNAIILLAADNDIWKRKADGTPYNPGLEAATKAATEVGGIVCAPPFCEADAWGNDEKGNPTGPKDWNDWHGINGAGSVAELIDAALQGASRTRVQQVVLVPSHDDAWGVAYALECLARLEDVPPSVFVVPYEGDGIQQAAKRASAGHPSAGMVILAAPGHEVEAQAVGEQHGCRVELPPLGVGEWQGWGALYLDVLFDAIDGRVDADLRAEVDAALARLAQKATAVERAVDVREVHGDGGAAGPATATRAGENEEFAVDPKAPFDIAHQLIARNWVKDGRRTLHRTGGAFYQWAGTHYEERGDESVRATLYRELDKACRLEDGAPFKPDASSVNRVEDALRAAAHLPGERPSECWIDGRGMAPAREIIAVQNGLLHMPARRLLPSDPNFFTLNSLPFNYDADAPQPVEWLKFLSTIWPNDPESIGLLQRWFGYMLSADTSHQKMLLLIGPKRSGKGTIARIMTSLLGKANVAGPTLSDFSNQFGLAQLIGRRAAIIGDARMSARADQGEIAGRLLSITGEDVLTIDRKHREPWIGTLPTRIVICSNELPRLQDASGALSSRFLILQMEQSFYGKEDRGLSERIESELPGILRWSLDGWDALQREGRFASPQSSMEALEELEGLSSPVKAFMEDVCEVNASALVDCAVLYQEWCAWCKSQGRDHPGTLQTFGRDLRAAAAGVKTQQYRVGDGSRARRFVGIGLRGPI